MWSPVRNAAFFAAKNPCVFAFGIVVGNVIATVTIEHIESAIRVM